MIGIVDYSLGNIQNIKNALDKLGKEYMLSSDKDDLKRCETIILPGVGHFGEAMKKIDSLGIKEDLIELSKSKRMIGICLGMQLLFETSEEGNAEGLGILGGDVRKIATPLPIPHLGWNTLDSSSEFLNGKDVYFIHTFKIENAPDVIATSEYGTGITAVVQKDNITGIQFHPEKSGDTGIEILKQAIEGGFQIEYHTGNRHHRWSERPPEAGRL